MSKVYAEAGDMFITAVKKVKDMMKPSESHLVLVFNGIEITVYHNSHPADLATIYDLKHELARMRIKYMS